MITVRFRSCPLPIPLASSPLTAHCSHLFPFIRIQMFLYALQAHVYKLTQFCIEVFGSPTPTQMQSPQQAPKPTLPLTGTSPTAAQHPQNQHTAPSQQHSPNPNSNAHPHPRQHSQSTPDREQRPSQPHTPLTPPLTPASSANNDASGSSVSSVSSASVGSTPMSASLSMSVGTPTTSPFTLAVPPCTPASPLLYRDRNAGDSAFVASPGSGGVGGTADASHRWPQRLALDFGSDIDFGVKLSAAAAAASDNRDLSIGSGYSADETSGSFSMRQLAVELNEVDGSGRLGSVGGPASPNKTGASMERSGRIDSVDDGARFLLVCFASCFQVY